ncbi:GNAT family N-acetyltransferase [Spirosoma aerophilum]
MRLVDLTAEKNYDYQTFILTGLTAFRNYFRISPNDQLNEPFPTQGLPDSFTLGLLTDSDELAGVVSFQREGQTREKIRHKGLLFRMYVAPAHAGKGLGRMLLEETIRRARLLPHMKQINLTCASTNEVAKRQYEKVGFRTFALEKNSLYDEGTYHDEVQMVLFLAE